MRIGKSTFKVLQLRRMLDLAYVAEIPGVLPRSIEVRGTRLDLASGVEINGIEVESFAILGANKLLAQIPNLGAGRVTDVSVYSELVTSEGMSRAYYDFGTHPWMTEGKVRVLQNFIKLLLTTPGTDIWSPRSGVGIQNLMVRGGGPQTETALAGELETRVAQTTQQIIQNQALDQSISAKERLLGAVVTEILVSSSDEKATVKITLKFHDGESMTAGFGW
jgi:hypothetical protein